LRIGQLSALAALLGLALGASQGVAAPANTLQDLFANLKRCMGPQSGPPGSQLTVVFSLRRDGSLLGTPRISFSKFGGDVEGQRKFTAGVAAAFDRCLPIAISDGLGGALAGRPIALRFVIVGRDQES